MKRRSLYLLIVWTLLGACSGETGSWVDQARSQRESYREKHVQLIRDIRSLVYQVDPIGPSHHDEYDSAIHDMVPRLKGCKSSEDVQRVVHQVFTRKFGATLAGPPSKYEFLSKRIWNLLDRKSRAG
jgi:hypothetical protein